MDSPMVNDNHHISSIRIIDKEQLMCGAMRALRSGLLYEYKRVEYLKHRYMGNLCRAIFIKGNEHN